MIFGRYARALPPASPTEILQASIKRRADGWVETSSGLGVGRMALGSFQAGLKISDAELSNLYYLDDLAAKVVDAPVDESFRAGYQLEGLADPEDEKALHAAAEALDLDTNFADAVRWGRLFGSSLLLMGILDNLDLIAPVNPLSKGKPLAFLNTVDRRNAVITTLQTDLTKPGYGKPAIYTVKRDGVETKVHASRTIRFDGIRTDEMKQKDLNGWAFSVLQRVYDRLREFGLSFAAVNQMITETSQGVWKIDGLLEMLAGGEQNAILARMRLADQSKSVAKSIMVDATKEDYHRVPLSFASVPELLDRLMMRVSAATGIPVSLLMGRSAAGMNATGEGDERAWNAQIKSFQEKELGPKLLAVYRQMALGLNIDTENLTIVWQPLHETTAAESGAIYKLTSDADNVLIQAGVVEPEAVAIARFGNGFYDPSASILVNVEKLDLALNAVVAVDQGGKLELTPSDIATITTVEEGRNSIGLEGTITPETLTVAGLAELQKQIATPSATPAAPAPPATPETT